MLLEKHTHLVMAGDSITDCDRERPGGEGHRGELGNGYVLLTEALLNATYPEQKIRVVNMGISGDTSEALAARWDRDVLSRHPNWVTVMIGINDVWRKLDCPYRGELHLPLEAYRSNLDRIIRSTRSAGANILLLSPFFIEPHKDDQMRAMCDEYRAACREAAQTHSCPFVDVQAAFDDFLAHNYSCLIAYDRVHPNTTGHMIIARALLRALEFTW